MLTYIFDLDGTVIDSSHRQAARADGTLDLDHWKANNTRRKIMADSLLPLARVWRMAYYRPAPVHVLTARVIGQDDLDFLNRNDLPFHFMHSRPEGNTMPDHALKWLLLRMHCQDIGKTWNQFRVNAVFFEDAPKTLELMRNKGLTCFDSIGYNAIMQGNRIKRKTA
jgi:hypothetical protein